MARRVIDFRLQESGIWTVFVLCMHIITLSTTIIILVAVLLTHTHTNEQYAGTALVVLLIT